MSFFSSLLGDVAQGVVRHLATASGGWLLAHGLLQASQLNDWLGSVIFIGGVAWSAYEKYSRRSSTG